MSQLGNNSFKYIGIIGAGAWGTALAMKCALNVEKVVIYSRDSDVVSSINNSNENKKHLSGIKLHQNITSTSNIKDLSSCDLLLISIPSQKIREFLEENTSFSPNKPVLVCSKGIENQSLKCLTDVVLEFWDCPIAVLSGPNFAKEVAMNKMSASTLASSDSELLNRISASLTSPAFSIYQTDDLMGVQMLGAAKNVIAIAAGISMGLDLGENCKAALITLGINESCKLISYFGGKLETALGFSGIGDLILTATSITSRNTAFGYKLAHGIKEDAINAATVEGYHSCKALYEIGIIHKIDLPIVTGLYNVLYNNKDANLFVEEVLSL